MIKRYTINRNGWLESCDSGSFVKYDDVELLQAQLAARDAALDAVLVFSDYGDVAQLKAMLAAEHGVHPK